MQPPFLFVSLAVAAIATACTLPTDLLPNTITNGFGILIQNPAFPIIHDTYMNLDPAGGGDNHLFLAPVGNPTFNLVLEDDILEQDIIHAVIDGEYDPLDNTTKMFMTERGDPKAIFTPIYGCNPDNDDVQIELEFLTREDSPYGGLICVRVASGNRGYEFRYSPPDNPAFNPANPCIPVTMVVIFASSLSSTTASTSGSSPSTTTGSTSTTSTTAALSTPTNPLQPATVNGVWTWYGCQTEATNMRALSLDSFAEDTMTLEACATFCTGYTYFGTEYARECYCGNSFNPGSIPAPETDCSFLCMGNALELCGAGLRLSVYVYNPVQSSPSLSSTSSTTSAPPSSSSSSSQSASSASQSAAPSSTSQSTTASLQSSSPSSTSQSAAPSSTSQSSSQSTSSTSQVSSSSSTTSTSSTVSASPTLGIKQTLGAYSFIGCYTEATNMRALTGASYYDYPAMTLEECLGKCAGFKYFGVEYGGECYCGNVLNPGSIPAPLTDCSFTCPGNKYEYCGAGVRLEMYELATFISSSSVATVTTSSTQSTSTSTSLSSSSSAQSVTTTSQSTSTSSSITASTPLPYTDMTPYGFAYVGCAPEERTAPNSPPGRTLSGTLYADDALTNAECMLFCSSNGYAFAGTEYTRECWCGNAVAPGREPLTTLVSLQNCNFPCGGDASQYCGGNAWLSLYQACAVGGPCVNQVFT